MGVFKLIFKFKKRSHQDLLVSKIPSIYIGCVFELIFKVHSLQHKKNQSLNNRAIIFFKPVLFIISNRLLHANITKTIFEFRKTTTAIYECLGATCPCWMRSWVNI